MSNSLRVSSRRITYEDAVQNASARSILVASLQWPIKRALRRLRVLDLARATFGRKIRGDLGLSTYPDCDLVLLTPGREPRTVRLPDQGRRVVVGVREEAQERPASQPSQPHMLLAGGWGYTNLGDEAILTGYLLEAANRGLRCSVLSVAPTVTRASQLGLEQLLAEPVRITDESGAALWQHASSGQTVVLAAGGYLNGAWRTEIGGKLNRLGRIAGQQRVLGHALEVRGLEHPLLADRFRRLFANGACSVRDSESAAEASRLGIGNPAVVPDGISLLYPYVWHLAGHVDSAAGRILVNLLDVPSRDDHEEAEFPTDRWVARCRALIEGLGQPALGLALDEADATFMIKELGMDVLLPRSVRGLVSAISSSVGLVTTRMHPALISTMLRKPTCALAYCGKVRPTLTESGLGRIVPAPGALALHQDFLSPADYDKEWRVNHTKSLKWLVDALGAPS